MVMKFVLCGDGSVGKTTLRRTYFGKNFESNYDMTIGADFAIKTVNLTTGRLAGESMKVQFWDLAGQPRFSIVRGVYYAGSHGAFLIYDCTRLESFENIVNWLQELKKFVDKRIPVILIANKTDLRSQVDISVSPKQGKKLAKLIKKYYLLQEFDVPFVETSAKTGFNVDLVFQTLVDLVAVSYS